LPERNNATTGKENVTMKTLVKKLIAGEEGATMVEYALMVALIGAALITVIGTLKTAISGQFTSVSTAVSGAGS
jgi:pilus assembly protein Flp/PilA